MGERFQIITNTEGHINVYHSQWLWGDYAIRRIGTAVRNFIRHNKEGYRPFEEYLKGSFYGKPTDMNNFYRYFSNENEWDGNKEICKSWKGKKKYSVKSKSLEKLLRSLDNNDGYFYIEFDEQSMGSAQKGVKGYCFIANDDSTPITAEHYMSNFKRHEGFSKKQEKEYQDGMKTFKGLPLIQPIKIIRVGD